MGDGSTSSDLENALLDRVGQLKRQRDALAEALRTCYWPLANIRRFNPDGDERYPHAHPDLLARIQTLIEPPPRFIDSALSTLPIQGEGDSNG